MLFFEFIVRVEQPEECVGLSASVPPLFRSNYFVISIHGQLRLLLFFSLASWFCLIS